MPDYFYEENNVYKIDCTKAIWATDEIHSLYKKHGLSHILCDADFVIESKDFILLVEYKNASIQAATQHASTTKTYDPLQNEKIIKIAQKYYDSLHYLHMMGKTKPIRYVFVVEFPNGDPVNRRLLKTRLHSLLPFNLQREPIASNTLIESLDVVSISEWNSMYSDFPFTQINSASN